MFVKDLDPSAHFTSCEFSPGYWNWNTVASEGQLNSFLKKLLCGETEFFSLKNISKEDIAAAMDLFCRHSASKGKVAFEAKLRYTENGTTLYMLCKGKITDWSNDGNASAMAGCIVDVTKLLEKKIELALENERYSLLTDSVNAGIWDWNIITGEQWWSDKYYDLLGYKRGEIASSHNIFRNILLHPDDRQKAEDATRAHLQNKTPFAIEIRIKGKDGNYRWYESTGKAKVDENGKPVRMVGSIVDKHERKQFQLELENRQQLLDEVSGFCKIGIWERHANVDEIFWSKGLYDITELPYDFVPAEKSLKEFHQSDEDFNGIHDPYNKCLQTGEPYKIVAPFTTVTGKRKWLCITGIPLKDKNNNVIGARGLTQDITEQETRTQILKKYQAELTRNEFLLSETGNMAKVGGWEFDLATLSVTWTREVYKVHEVSPDVVPSFELVQSLYPEESREVLMKAVEECITVQKEYDFEIISLTAAGEKKWIRAIGKPIVDEAGNVVMLRGTVQDIDEMKRKELELQKSNEIINSQNQRLNNYAHIVSHNLRTHAGNIGTILTMIEESDDPEEKQNLMTHLHKISSGLNETVQHLNDVAKIQMEIQESKVSLRFTEIFDKTKYVLMPTINETNTTIETDFSELETVEYIPAYLESIMLNLMSNAIKYRHPERHPHIVIKSFVKDNKSFLQVSDNGKGIDLEKYRHKMFGMYQTFHKNADARGIGLFMTKNQLEALGGNINVISKPGAGATFVVQF